jgi:hypothetical protein
MTDKINITPMVIKSCKEELKTFETKHVEIEKEKIEYFKEILEEKYKIYSSNANVFLSYIYYKI